MGSMWVSRQEVRTLARLRSFEETWRALHRSCSNPSGFTTWEWLWNWWTQFGPVGVSRESAPDGSDITADCVPFRQPLHLITVRDNHGGVIGLIPLYASHHRGNGLRLTVLRLVGDIDDARENPFEEPLVLLQRGREPEVAHCLESWLQKPGNGLDFDVSRIALPCAAEQRSAETSERRRLGEIGSLRKVHAFEEIQLPDSYETLYRSLNKSMRDNLSYYPRLLQRRGHVASVRVASSLLDMRAATETLIALHRERAFAARGVPHADHLPTCAQQNFLREYLADLAARGMASIYTLEVDGVAAAAQIVLHGADDICLYYSGFATRWYDYSPLTILMSAILKDAISAGKRRVNLLPGAHPWKKRWGASAVDSFTRVLRPRLSPVSLARCAAYGIAFGSDSRLIEGNEQQVKTRSGREALATAVIG